MNYKAKNDAFWPKKVKQFSSLSTKTFFPTFIKSYSIKYGLNLFFGYTSKVWIYFIVYGNHNLQPSLINFQFRQHGCLEKSIKAR